MRNRWSLLLFFAGSVFLAWAPGATPTPAQTEGCVTAVCHPTMGKEQFVHNPVKEGMCTTCHQVADDPQKKTKHPNNLVITLSQQGSELCAMCHEPKNVKKVVHAPIMGGDCTSCHNPHQSPNKGMLKAAMPDICFQCHPDSIVKHKVMHPPVAGGDCSGCHDNHQSDFPNRLMADGNALCFQCHPDKEEGLKTKKVGHYPVKQSCVQCHSPHGSETPAMLSAAVPDLCANCHPNEAMARQRSLTKHGPMIDQKSCKNCHDPHFSDQSKLLLTSPMALCLACHNKELETGRGKIMDMKALFDQNKNAHGPIKGGDCISCHNPHGSNFWRILTQYYPSEFYTTYADGKYALCFSCHDKTAFTEQKTKVATGFRDGERNLHFVHVNKVGKGRTCRACHEVHADSGQYKHVKQGVLFSGWNMPMNFVPVKNGGACLPGCHGEKKYSR
ncbi:MAG: cytochrome C [Nitrospirota bacterium]|nr:cytochrome C [Nitrospirota bacterium]